MADTPSPERPPLPVLKGVFFITGTDTEVGKTWVSCRLLERAREAGLSCYGLKPIAAGCEETADGLRNEDAVNLMASSSLALPYDVVNPVALKAAIAPHIAARQEGQKDEGQAFGQERFYQVGLWIFVIGFVLFA